MQHNDSILVLQGLWVGQNNCDDYLGEPILVQPEVVKTTQQAKRNASILNAQWQRYSSGITDVR